MLTNEIQTKLRLFLESLRLVLMLSKKSHMLTTKCQLVYLLEHQASRTLHLAGEMEVFILGPSEQSMGSFAPCVETAIGVNACGICLNNTSN